MNGLGEGMTEIEIRGVILKYLKSIGAKVRVQQKHSKSRTNMTEKGWPDISGYLGSRGLFIEVKKPGGSLTLEQHAFITDAKKNGHLAFFATSVEDVKRELRVEGEK
jgi:hypothetical protein